MSIIIVTSHQYVIAEKIHSVVLEEYEEILELVGKNGKPYNRVSGKHRICISYTPESKQLQQLHNHQDIRDCYINITSKYQVNKVYRDVVSQIREQMPDELFLSQAVEQLLKTDLPEDKKESIDDASTKKIRRARKTKRNRKKVLQRPKRGN